MKAKSSSEIFKKNKNKKWVSISPITYFIILIICIYAFLLLHKLGTVPGIFFDEANYATEVESFSSYGTDIHGLHLPVYLESIWGQGQSILYAIFAVPFVKLLGFNIFVFRLQMVIIGILFISCFTYLTKKISNNTKLTLFVLTMLISSPWSYMSLRWVLDANIGPLILNIGICLIILGLARSYSIYINKFLIYAGAALLGLSAYGYMALWLYLPLTLMLIAIYLIKQQMITFRELTFCLIIITVIVLPLIVFALNIFVLHSTRSSNFLIFDIPVLPASRQSSLINFAAPNLINELWDNFAEGINIYVSGFDNLPWNSIKGYGVIHPIFLMFTVIGLISPSDFFKGYKHVVVIIKIMILSFIPLMFIVIPNYNHWNVVNFPIIIMAAFGLYYSYCTINKSCVANILYIIPLIVMFLFLQSYWSENSYPINGMINYNTVKNINDETKNHELFISNLAWNFTYFKLVKNVSPNEYEKDQDHLTSLEGAPKNKFDNLFDISQTNKLAKKGDFILVDSNENSQFYQDKKMQFTRQIPWGKAIYHLFEIV